MDAESIDPIVSGFYKAAVGEWTWHRPLEAVCDLFGARGAVLQSIHRRTCRQRRTVHGGAPVHHALLDKLRAFVTPGEHGAAAGTPDHWWHSDELSGEPPSPRAPSESVSHMSARLLTPSVELTSIFALGFDTMRGPMTPAQCEVARRLGVHLRDALALQERLRPVAARSLAGSRALQATAMPTWLVEPDLHLLYANASALAEQYLQRRVVVSAEQFGLRKSDCCQTLRAKVAAVCAEGPSATGVVDLRGADEGLPVWLHLSCLVPSEALGAFGDEPRLLITLVDPEQMRALEPASLVKVFGLTLTEAKVAALIAEGVTAETIARTHGTAASTVRTQIRQVLEKLGARRTTDVVRMLRQGESMWARL